jgi:hypothetical protein
VDLAEQINNLISQAQFQVLQKDKELALLSILREQIKRNMDFSPHLKKFYLSLGKYPEEYQGLIDIPPIPVSAFKFFDLKTCPDSEITRTMHSSGTSTSIPSKIFINKETGFRQTKGLISILKNFLGVARRPFLVLDTENVNKTESTTLSARGAAIRGIAGNFGRQIVYLMDERNGQLFINFEKLDQFCEQFKDQDILVSGFTYIIWDRFVKQMKEAGRKLNFPNVKIVHSGGWKKLKAEAVTKEVFSANVAELFSTDPTNILDFYGMVEQLGVIFLDCEAGYKHPPDFADIIIRDLYSMKENPIGLPGAIEVLSIIPSSYPGQALITEDLGELLGIDDCPCGRKGKYFVFRSRVERTETRGCGDTFAEKQKITQKEGS